jgi:hypothetical protein
MAAGCFGGIETFSIIFNHKQGLSRLQGQRNRNPLSIGILDRIGNRLLGDPVQTRLNPDREWAVGSNHI